jgi:hypothetical protein
VSAPIAKYLILDETGCARAWLKAGRGIAVWADREISGHPAPDVLTPGDRTTPTHSRYGATPARILRSPDEVTFFAKGPVHYGQDAKGRMRHAVWSSTPAGRAAAEREADRLTRERPDNGTAPHKLAYRYSAEEIQMDSRERYAHGGRIGPDDRESTPLLTQFRWVVVVWSAPRGEA